MMMIGFRVFLIFGDFLKNYGWTLWQNSQECCITHVGHEVYILWNGYNYSRWISCQPETKGCEREKTWVLKVIPEGQGWSTPTHTPCEAHCRLPQCLQVEWFFCPPRWLPLWTCWDWLLHKSWCCFGGEVALFWRRSSSYQKPRWCSDGPLLWWCLSKLKQCCPLVLSPWASCWLSEDHSEEE